MRQQWIAEILLNRNKIKKACTKMQAVNKFEVNITM